MSRRKDKDRDEWGFFHTKEIFEYLKPFAAAGNTVTYGTVAKDVGGSPQSLGGRELTAIQEECDKRCWPHLSALVVGKRTGIPGSGYNRNGHAVDDAQFKEIKQEIFGFSWSDKHI